MMHLASDYEKIGLRLLDCIDGLFIFMDIQENILLCNKRLEEAVGLKRESLVGKNWAVILYRDTASSIQQQMFKAVIDDSVFYKRKNNFEGLFLDNTLGQRHIFWDIIPVSTNDTNLEGILLFGHDITELRERQMTLKKMDETMKNIFSSIREYALYVANLDGNITYYAMGAEKMFGWGKEEIVFKHVSIFHPHEDADSLLPGLFEQVKKIGQVEIETNLIKKDKEVFPVILTVSPFLDTDGKLVGYVFIAKDITERKKLEYQVFQAEKMAAIGQLAAGMAHEINNPLFVISGRLEMLLEDGGFSPQIRQDLVIVQQQGDRIRKLVDRLLKFSRHSTPKFDKINLNEVLESVLPLLSYHKLPEAKVTIQKELADDLKLAMGDFNQLQEVFLNLLINACQAMPQGGVLTIKTYNTEDSFVAASVSDTGCGISPKDLKNIFMPFYSTKKEGTGLGLSICYNIIRNHNGNIDVDSEVNKGTTFLIKLPFAK